MFKCHVSHTLKIDLRFFNGDKVSNSSKKQQGALALAALGVVYGDIGTSPLYAFKEAFAHGMAVNETNVLATLSAFFWAMMLIISLKYVWVVIRFDNEGEGGVLALTALAQRVAQSKNVSAGWLLGAGIFAAALFYGDSFITPAISVLSAVEGISVVTPRFNEYVTLITVVIIVGLFMVQKHGTQRIGGTFFGPIMVVWFGTLAVLGVMSIAQTPAVLAALNPTYAFSFAVNEPKLAFILLAAVFLALTGGEALYADMGHFGARSVRLAWYGLACPALLLNYFGQGALALRDASSLDNPFYMLAPDWFLLPLVVLATAATVIASQATIAGAYSMTLEAMRLDLLPRLRILHTSDSERGQIYIPSVNWLMLIGVLVLVLSFGSSSALAAAYGIAVSGTMMITTILLAFVVAHTQKNRAFWLSGLAVFGVLELLFLSSNLTKIASGGWMPLALGLAIYTILSTWRKGAKLIAAQRRVFNMPIEVFLKSLSSDVPRVQGTAVYLTSDADLVPTALFHNLKHYKVMHEQIVFLNVVIEGVPHVKTADRYAIEMIAPNVYRLFVLFGFREETDLQAVLSRVECDGLNLNPMDSTFFLARSKLIDEAGGLNRWQFGVFSSMFRQADGAANHFNLPPNRVVELGAQVAL